VKIKSKEEFPQDSDERLNDRLTTYDQFSSHLAGLNDEDLSVLLDKANPLHDGIGGTSASLELFDKLVFVKKIKLTDLERLPEHFMSTANLFELPTYYQYGVGSAGLGVWRELAAHTMTTNWVLDGECPNFPILYHWRVLSTAQPEQMDEEQLKDLESRVSYWEGSPAVRARLEALHSASAEVVLFLEYFPENLQTWYENKIVRGGEALNSATTMIEHDLQAISSFINARGLLHFDTHFRNIMTDGDRLYFADFGLALSSEFKLSDTEREFFDIHKNYDQCQALTYFLYVIISTLFSKDKWEDVLQEFADGKDRGPLPPSIVSIIERYTPIAVVMWEFHRKLMRETKIVPYPADELSRLLAYDKLD